MMRALSRNMRPCAVAWTPELERSKMRYPKVSSRVRTWALRLGWDIYMLAAAWLIDPQRSISITALKMSVRRCRSLSCFMDAPVAGCG